jgi:uncharacterized protein YjbI with pentapeptide repeats
MGVGKMTNMQHFVIRDRWTNKPLYEGDGEDLRSVVVAAVAARADLTDANLTDANLTRAYLADANLADANLAGANLTGANLARANLTGANLTRANLTDAYLTGANLADVPDFRYRHPLQILRDQTGTIRAYKAVLADGTGPYAAQQGYHAIRYVVGESYSVTDANTDEWEACGAGIHVTTLDWCRRLIADGGTAATRILIVEFEAADIAAIPHASDGKWRLFRCKVVGEWREPDGVRDAGEARAES